MTLIQGITFGFACGFAVAAMVGWAMGRVLIIFQGDK